jgi:hypothetical protein
MRRLPVDVERVEEWMELTSLLQQAEIEGRVEEKI